MSVGLPLCPISLDWRSLNAEYSIMVPLFYDIRQSAIVVGPVCSGKRCVAAQLGSGGRRLLTLDECVEWALAASGKKKKLEGAGPENGRFVEELIRNLEAQEGDAEASGGKKSRRLHHEKVPVSCGNLFVTACFGRPPTAR